jgi:phospholipid/cholesterol/gamma-HCH transport system substrate-binding protein
MNERQMQFRVGVVVLATMIIGGLLATLSGPIRTSVLPWARRTYTVGIKVDKAPGVDQNTPVRKNGILIGRVKSIEEQPDGMLLIAEINSNRPLFAEYDPHIRTTVIGDATIDFEFDFRHKRLAADAQPVPDGYEFHGTADESPFDAIAKFGALQQDFAEAAHSLNLAGNEVSKLAAKLNETLGDGNKEGKLTHLVDSTDRAMRQFEATLTAFNEILGDPAPNGTTAAPTNVARPFNGQQQLNQPPNGAQPPGVQPPGVQPPAVQPNMQQPGSGQEMRRKLREGLNELPDAVRDMRSTMNEFRTVLQSAEKNFRNLEGFTEPLGQKGTDITTALLRAVNGLDRLVTDFSPVAQALQNRQSTIGQLLYEGKAYDNFNILMFNANQVLTDIRDLTFRLKPVINNARIFTDKIATEPGRIITGGLNPSVVK